MTRRPTPLGAIVRGVVAGAIGTLAMDYVWYRRYRAGGGEDSFGAWEFSSGTTGYENAGAPAQVGRRLVEAYLQRSLSEESAGTMNNVVHWLTGLGWGAVHGVLFGAASRVKSPLLGLFTGTTAWGTSYLILAPAGVYQPITEYEAETLWKDLSAHLVFGATTGAVYALIGGSKG